MRKRGRDAQQTGGDRENRSMFRPPDLLGAGPLPRTESEAASAIVGGLQQVHARLHKVMHENYALVDELAHVRVGRRIAHKVIDQAMPKLLLELEVANSGRAQLHATAAATRELLTYFETGPDEQSPLEDVRRRIIRCSDQSNTGLDQRGVARIRELFDDIVEKCITAGAVARGSEKQALLWWNAVTEARAARTAIADGFEPQSQEDIAAHIVSDLVGTPQPTSQVANRILGKGSFGAYGPAPYVVRRLKYLFERDPHAWSAVRCLAWMRLVEGEPTEGVLSSRLRRNGGLLGNLLFSSSEQHLLTKMSDDQFPDADGAPL